LCCQKMRVCSKNEEAGPKDSGARVREIPMMKKRRFE
jgi:hypothetical protein